MVYYDDVIINRWRHHVTVHEFENTSEGALCLYNNESLLELFNIKLEGFAKTIVKFHAMTMMTSSPIFYNY